jgi:hypothetical protein
MRQIELVLALEKLLDVLGEAALELAIHWMGDLVSC